MVLKANDRRTSCPCHDEFRGPRSDYVRQRQKRSSPQKRRCFPNAPGRWIVTGTSEEDSEDECERYASHTPPDHAHWRDADRT
ncbi:hypothetical protein TNCV_366281 [Trichonephila clavipes]|nr:hypothetical protein TNCV_366281 [Trichonephila clavipes]